MSTARTTCRVMWPEPVDGDDRNREQREDRELAAVERDRVEARRELAAEEDPDAEHERAAERERVARAELERAALEQEQAEHRHRDREHDARRRPLRRVTTVSISGVNTTNKPVMNAEFDVDVR